MGGGGRGSGGEGGDGETRRDDGGELRYETMENLAKEASPSKPCRSSARFSPSSPRFLYPTLSFSFVSPSRGGRAAPRRGSQMNRFNEKMASSAGAEGTAGCRCPPSRQERGLL